MTLRGTPEPDGTPVRLDVSMLATRSDQPRPAVVLAHGFGGRKTDSAGVGRSLARAGYVVFTYTARGFGRSGGKIHLDNPGFEGRDATRVVDLAATRPEVQKIDGDPVVGFAGASYGGAVALLAAGLDPRIDAIAPAFTWHSLTQALFPQYATTGRQSSPAEVSPVRQAGVFKQRWASLFFLNGGGLNTGGASDDGAGRSAGRELCGRFTLELCRGYTATARSGRPDRGLVTLLDQSSTEPFLGRITAPTLIIQGEQDTLFPLDHADANLRGLPASTPSRMSWVAGGHDSQISLDALLPELTGWFGRYLKHDQTPAAAGFDYVVPQTSLVGRDGGTREPEQFSLTAYPGRGTALRRDDVRLHGQKQTMVSPPGGSPAALTSLPGSRGALSGLAGAGSYPLGVLPGQSVIFTTDPLDRPRTLVGRGAASLTVTSSTSTATLFATLWDLGPATDAGPSTAVLPQQAVAPLHLAGLVPGRPTTVRLALPPVVHRVPVGHRLQLVVSSTDQAYAIPTSPTVYTVGLAGEPVLSLPDVTGAPLDTATVRVPLPLLVVVAALVLAALVAMVVLWLRRRSAHPRPELRGTPLVVEDLVKTYRDGTRAVDGVSFSAEAGQVIGLLGPNGAGKTTTMRMMVGLIRPDSGGIWVAGEAVHAGADVLGSVGALIEGPGFLPHLTGLQNLQAYWQATGRPAAEARLEQALEIAGLGSAVHRRVRGYSQGMRQRLGIAQAMLGLPELLLLDEPTNGLDPPQIKAMRTVLTDYAATGRTVVVSSHLLAEVEQTCSHVVVMHNGRVVLSGAIDELTVTPDVTVIGFEPDTDPASAAAVLRELGLEVQVEGHGLRVHGDRPRAELVSTLVQHGFGIDGVDGHRHLEEVFMSLVTAPAEVS
nr:alpha/beta fold hydrolase [Microlunatus panaciterrae]